MVGKSPGSAIRTEGFLYQGLVLLLLSSSSRTFLVPEMKGFVARARSTKMLETSPAEVGRLRAGNDVRGRDGPCARSQGPFRLVLIGHGVASPARKMYYETPGASYA